MDDTTNPEIRVVASGRLVALLTNKWFQRFRHALPLALLVSIGIALSFPALGNEYLILVPLLVACCTVLTRHVARAAISATDDGEQSKVLLELNGKELYLNIDSTDHYIDLNECSDIRVYRALWWLSPFIVFAIKRRDGYEKRTLTHIDTPELYSALKRISDNINPEKQDDPGPTT